MSSWRSLIINSVRARPILNKIPKPMQLQKRGGSDGPAQPFDNLPFSVPNRYVCTLCFTIFGCTAFYAPFAILWYMMAKKTL